MDSTLSYSRVSEPSWTRSSQAILKSARLHALGAPLLWGLFHIDYLVNQHLLEPKALLNEHLILPYYGACYAAWITYTWLALSFAPFSLVPALVYPCYYMMKHGDREVVDDVPDL